MKFIFKGFFLSLSLTHSGQEVAAITKRQSDCENPLIKDAKYFILAIS